MNPFSSSTPPASGNPPPLHPDTMAVRALEKSVVALETYRELMVAQLQRNSTSLDEMRERLARLEQKVDGLPTKEWFGGVIRASVATAAALVTLAGAAGALILHLVGR